MFWIVSGIVFYLSGSFFFNILDESSGAQIQNYWFYSYSFDIVKNILFSFALTLFKKEDDNNNSLSEDVPFLDFDHFRTIKE